MQLEKELSILANFLLYYQLYFQMTIFNLTSCKFIPTHRNKNFSSAFNVKLFLTDIKEKNIELKFSGEFLIGIGNRLLDKPKKIYLEKGKFYLKILEPKQTEIAQTPEKPSISTREKTICDKLPDDAQEILKLEQAHALFNFLCRRATPQDTLNGCPINVQSNYNYKFLSPCLDSKGNALTSTYRLVYDVRKMPEPFTILKLKKGKGYEYYTVKKRINPIAKRELVVTVIGEKDSTYIITSNSTQNFMEYEGDFAKALENISTAGATPATKTDSTAKKDSTTKPAPKDELQKARELKTKMYDLSRDLSEFNTVLFPTIDFSEDAYQRELSCLQKNIARIFNIPIPKSGDQFADTLANQVEDIKVPYKYYQDFCTLIQEIKVKYDEAINKKVKYFVSSQEIYVPNEDEFELSIKTKNGVEILKPRTYQISGGFKIDFSTGFFHSGLSSSDFTTGSQFFRFKETRDTILASGKDSIIYTGDVRDTTLSVIRKNKRLSFGTGFYVHFYPRSGGAVNAGGSAGVILDNNGQVQFLLGGSLMFNVGKSRVAIVGGYARGREKTLSSENNQYYWNGGSTLINSKYDLPKNFSGTNPATYEKWKSSWFIGLTFNFVTVPVGKKS